MVKNRIGNVEVKELVCMTHAHELRAGCWSDGGAGLRGIKRGKNKTNIIA